MESTEHEPDPIMFFSFGMFIIDEIEHLPNPETTQPTIEKRFNLPGGAGLYALLGARLLSPPPHSRHLSWILDAGSDIPQSTTDEITSWSTSTRIRHDATRLTTRAWNGYGPNDLRTFKYLTPKQRLDARDLDDQAASGRGWHMVCSAARCAAIVAGLRARRRDDDAVGVVSWEPIPDLCSPGELVALRVAAQGVDVVSPNADELRMYFGTDAQLSQDEMVSALMGWNHDPAPPQANSATAHRCSCVIREGSRGSTLYFPPTTGNTIRKVRLPAYHTPTTAQRVIDPTGGGNTYLGALTVVLAYLDPLPQPQHAPPASIALAKTFVETLPGVLADRQKALVTAGICACVAAGFAIEQSGVPELTDGQGEEELWGGRNVLVGLRGYLERLRGDGYVVRQLRGEEV